MYADYSEMNPELEGFEFPDSLLSNDSPNASRKVTNAKNKTSKFSFANANKGDQQLPSVAEEVYVYSSEDENYAANTPFGHYRSMSSRSLTPPGPDLRKEQMILSSDEAMVDMRKRNKAALANLNRKGVG